MNEKMANSSEVLSTLAAIHTDNYNMALAGLGLEKAEQFKKLGSLLAKGEFKESIEMLAADHQLLHVLSMALPVASAISLGRLNAKLTEAEVKRLKEGVKGDA